MEALAFQNQAFCQAVDISYISSTSFAEAMRMDTLQQAAFLRRITAHKELEREAVEEARAEAGG